MALPPTIPTSFVPKQPVAPTQRKHQSTGNNPFLVLSYIILAVALLGAFGVFGYQYYLGDVAKKKAADLVKAENSIDQATVSDFIRLRDRFTTGKQLLNNHITLSVFFDALETITLQNIRFTSLKVTVESTRSATIEMDGIAKNFNTLAAQSSAFAGEKRIKRAIFSGITLDQKSGNVTFQLKADLDPSLVVENATGPTGTVQAPPLQGSTTPPVIVAPPITTGTSSKP